VDRDAVSGERQDLSVSTGKANLYSSSSCPSWSCWLDLRLLLGYDSLSDGATFERPLYAIVGIYALGFFIVAIGIVTHEAIHGFAWAYFSGKPLSAVEFGFQVRTLTPMRTVKSP
jgi:hypothetical protein